jgi:hypothetical protein
MRRRFESPEDGVPRISEALRRREILVSETVENSLGFGIDVATRFDESDGFVTRRFPIRRNDRTGSATLADGSGSRRLARNENGSLGEDAGPVVLNALDASGVGRATIAAELLRSRSASVAIVFL